MHNAGNEKREKDTHPHFKGNAIIDGVEYWVSAWKRDPDGNPKAPALKFSFQKKEVVHGSGMQQAQQAVSAPPSDFDDSDGIPF